MTDLPTARSMLPQTFLCLWVWCKACGRRGPADLDSGRGDVPVKDLKFRCAKCGSRLTALVVMGRDAMRVQPWKADGDNPGPQPDICAGGSRGVRWIECYAADAALLEGRGISFLVLQNWAARRIQPGPPIFPERTGRYE